MTEPYRHRALVRWGDVDFNGHMANTAYLNFGADSRMAFFKSRGFTIGDFQRLRFGPVIFSDELAYFKELHLMDEVEVTLACVGMSAGGGKFRLRNEYFNESGDRCATLLSAGAWMDLDARKLRTPPPELVALFQDMPLAPDFAEIPAH